MNHWDHGKPTPLVESKVLELLKEKAETLRKLYLQIKNFSIDVSKVASKYKVVDSE